jgi:hypothetical protein
LKTRCTTLVPIPSFRPILSIPSPLALNSSIRASIAGSTRRRPSLVSFARARAKPALMLGLAVWHAIPESGFGPENIAQVNQSIRDNFSQKNMQVTEINLIRENKQKLSGYIRVRIPGVAEPVQKSCTATMDDNFEKFIWSCG